MMRCRLKRLGYVKDIRTRLGLNGNGRVIEEQEFGRCVLREEPEPYNAVFDPKNERLRPESGYSVIFIQHIQHIQHVDLVRPRSPLFLTGGEETKDKMN
jgi:hypothetical protein